MSFLHTEADLQAGMAALVAQDARLAPILELSGMPALRRREGGYAGLCAIVCGQQLSTASAAAIRDRLMAAFDPFHHDTVRLARADRLKRLGLSNAKIKSIKAIGHAISKGRIDLNAVASMEADKAHAALTALHGIGPWTADIYLLFCLGNADAWPAGDLAVQKAVRLALGLKKRPDAKAMLKLAEPWRPWRGVAAHLFWAYYRVLKRREGIEVTAKPETTKPESTKPESTKPAPAKPAPAKPASTKPAWPAVKAKRSVKKANGAALKR
jgi:DNA-3-methyladenine glycosylase II